MTCDCTDQTLRIVTAIHECTYPPSSDGNNNNTNNNQHKISLGDVLCTGRLLVRNWERLNGCFNVSTHLDTAMLRTIAEAADSLLRLYDIVGVSAGIFPAIEQGSTDRERGGTGTSRMMTSSSPRTIITPSYSSATGDTALVTVQQATYLGTHALEQDEAVIVGRESLRHSILLLGEVLHDISKDFEDLGGGNNEDLRAILDRSSTDMLRLLGRINN